MPVIFGISLIGLIHMLLGTVLVLFVLIKYLLRPKKKKTAGYLTEEEKDCGISDPGCPCHCRRWQRTVSSECSCKR